MELIPLLNLFIYSRSSSQDHGSKKYNGKTIKGSLILYLASGIPKAWFVANVKRIEKRARGTFNARLTPIDWTKL